VRKPKVKKLLSTPPRLGNAIPLYPQLFRAPGPLFIHNFFLLFFSFIVRGLHHRRGILCGDRCPFQLCRKISLRVSLHIHTHIIVLSRCFMIVLFIAMHIYTESLPLHAYILYIMHYFVLLTNNFMASAACSAFVFSINVLFTVLVSVSGLSL